MLINPLEISIHAPPRGATFASMHGRLQKRLFQFTPLREGRPLPVIFRRAYEYFNSRPSARGDSQLDVIGDIASDFNSRPSARGDGWPHQKARCCTSFQFTPLREGRLTPEEIKQLNAISIHAPPRGATFASMHGRLQKRLFQFTPLREGRPLPVIFRRAYEYFNSRPSARGDSQLDVIGDIASDFNSRPSARGDGWPHQKARCCTSFQFTPLREGRLTPEEIKQLNAISIHAPPRGATTSTIS